MVDCFELTILDSGDATRPVAMARYGFDTAFQTLSDFQLNGFSDFHQRLAASAAGRALARPTKEELTAFGRALFALLVRDRIKRVYDRLPAEMIKLQICSDLPALQAIAWEYFQEPGCTPGPNALRSVVRIVPTVGVPAPRATPLGEKVRMLFVYAEPPREQGVGWPRIKASIESLFRKRLPESFDLEVVEAATTRSFMNAFKGRRYDILHIVCHGEVAADGQGALVFQNESGRSKEAVAAATLGNFLKDKKLRLVVLSACNTSAGDFSKDFATVAKTLVECGVPAVLANQFEITNAAAASFAEGFYSELLTSGDLDSATMAGRLQLDFGADLPNGAARMEWGIPTLYRHLGGAKVFQP